MDRARELLEDFLSSSAEDRWRGRALGLLARVEEGSGRPERARELLRQAIDSHWRQGDLGREISDRCLLVRVAYYDLGDFAAAAKELENIPRPPPGDGDSHYLVALYRGTLALYSGNARSAYADLAAAQE
ncbi:MAG: hypothetical protein KDD47_22935, partial [Acidobacteria bacterium]|nr:hypothetical protein [Acidobacteriota bacterium]